MRLPNRTDCSAVGSLYIQIAKHIVGCKRIIGIAGGKEKCDW
jgi:NADPH-dependent curcumin reductase CurA